MRFALALLVALCVDLATASSLERLSLCIGNNIGLVGEARLLYATEDARRVHTLLAELGGVAHDRGYLLLNQNPEEIERTLGEIEGRIKEIRKNGKAVELLVFYSGHASSQSLHLGGQSWPMEHLQSFLGRAQADLKITILDACNSGAFITRKGGRLAESARFQAVDEIKTRGSVVLTSSSALEYSHESKALRGSLFSHYLLSALRGAADYDRDRAVSLWEAYHYARIHTVRHLSGGNGKQSPAFDFSVAGEKELVITTLDRGKARIRFESCPPGSYTLFNQSLSEQWAVVDLRDGDTVELSLPRMAFAIQRSDERVLHEARADLRYQDAITLKPRSFQRGPLPELRGKGGFLHLPASLMLRVRHLDQPPEQEATLWIPEVAFQVQAGPRRFGIHLGWNSSETQLVRRIIRRGPALGLSAGYERFLFHNFTAGAELRYDAWILDEETILPLPYPGASSWPADDGLDLGLFQGLGVDLRLCWRPDAPYFLEAAMGVQVYGYKTPHGDFEASPTFPITLGIGFGL